MHIVITAGFVGDITALCGQLEQLGAVRTAGKQYSYSLAVQPWHEEPLQAILADTLALFTTNYRHGE